MTRSARPWLLLIPLAIVAAPAFGGEAPGSVGQDGDRQELVAAVHVHSRVSTGSLTLDQLAEHAEHLGLDAVILSDNLVLRYEYGLFPLPGVIRARISFPSVLEFGVDRFLEEVSRVQARHPRLLLVPGVEAAPHYYWTGSLLTHDLTMHNSQKNLLVFGLHRAEDYSALPVAGNPASDRLGWEEVLNLTPAALFVPALWLWRFRTFRKVRVGVVSCRSPRRYRVPAVVLAVTASLLLINAWPFGQSAFSIYNGRLGDEPYQRFIDAVEQRGGVVIWSMPEARDFTVRSWGPIGPVTVRTEPYLDALKRTTGYTGFGGLYQEGRTATDPGAVWDELLRQSLAGTSPPPFITGEIAFHRPGEAGIELDQVLTILRVRERSTAGIIEAFRTGRLYAVVQSRKGFGLRLKAFRVEGEGGARRAESGETLDPGSARDLTLRLSVAATDNGVHPVSAVIVRSGLVIARLSGETPLEQQVTDRNAPPGEWHSYRVVVTSQDAELASNPVFVKPIMEGHKG